MCVCVCVLCYRSISLSNSPSKSPSPPPLFFCLPIRISFDTLPFSIYFRGHETRRLSRTAGKGSWLEGSPSSVFASGSGWYAWPPQQAGRKLHDPHRHTWPLHQLHRSAASYTTHTGIPAARYTTHIGILGLFTNLTGRLQATRPTLAYLASLPT